MNKWKTIIFAYSAKKIGDIMLHGNTKVPFCAKKNETIQQKVVKNLPTTV